MCGTPPRGMMSRMSVVDLASLSDQLADAVDRAAPSVVQVRGSRRPASGVVFEPDLVLTTTRALGKEDGLQITGPDGRETAAELAGWDPATGLVLVRAAGLGATPAAASRLIWWARNGTPPTSSRCFGRCVVSGSSRVPKPPATMTASRGRAAEACSTGSDMGGIMPAR